MNKHTPGPWNVQPWQWNHGASLAIVAPNNGYIVAVVPFDEDIQVEDEPDYDTVRRHPDEIPNANMLAAAPAMYEALQTLVEYLSAQVPADTLDDWKHVFAARQALAQAEGKP